MLPEVWDCAVRVFTELVDGPWAFLPNVPFNATRRVWSTQSAVTDGANICQ